MTHREAFTKIAEAYLTPFHANTGKQHNLTHLGLCDAIKEIGVTINGFHHLNPSSWNQTAWWWAPSDNNARCMCALLIAEIGKTEFDLLLKEAQDE